MASPAFYIRELKTKMKTIDAFLMRCENYLLDFRWENDVPHPRGPKRFEDPQWAAYVMQHLANSEVTFEVYKAWCLGGNGDRAFLEETCAANKDNAA